MIQPQDLTVATLGEPKFHSPLVFASPSHDRQAHFVTDSMRIRYQVEIKPEADETDRLSFEEAGPRERIKQHFAQRNLPLALKYLDPSYLIRSVPANVYDRFLCDQMARHAVHAAMAGKTGMLVGHEHNHFIHVPIPTVVGQKKQVDLGGDLWRAVLQVTRQPRW